MNRKSIKNREGGNQMKRKNTTKLEGGGRMGPKNTTKLEGDDPIQGMDDEDANPACGRGKRTGNNAVIDPNQET